MQAPSIHNIRFPDQAEILLSKMSLPFKGSRVVDLGCGMGDLVFFAANNGAQRVVGVEHNPGTVALLKERLLECENRSVVSIAHKSIEKFTSRVGKYDLAFCFSVLTYLEDPVRLLSWMGRSAKYVYVECQYAGDGPGYEDINSDADFMSEFLKPAGLKGKVIGKTQVEYRNKYRSIWELQRVK